ncbi:AbrB family transcriptional regulator [Tropicimonas sp. IMCC34043]|uniref:AbrB family transcriptional regulator n=1 Tax=Tropicimonas sp. IMCC34043 TaxID=2248760 RepID=UPI000E21F439|nr:AbrB family transcriptional regulator [Tropicimonas sp. IMCC34043]
MTPLQRLPPRILTVMIAALGVATFAIAGLPLPFLFGPMAACLIAALFGAPLKGLGQISVAARTILGVAVGASITPDLLHQVPLMAASVALIPVYIALIALIGVPFFNRLCGFDPVTSFYAAMPGGLQDMVIFGEAAGANVRTLSLVHATRILIIVTVAPIVLTQFYGVSLTKPIGAPAAAIPLKELALMAVAALVGWKGGERIGLFGASILGPMMVAAAFSLAGWIHMRPPKEAILMAQFFIGMAIGVFYVGVTLRELRQVVVSGVAFVLILAALAAAFTEIVTLAGFAGPVEAFLSYAPGGQAEMTVLAIVTGADLGFVITHHLTRIVLVIAGAPIAARLLGVRKR